MRRRTRACLTAPFAHSAHSALLPLRPHFLSPQVAKEMALANEVDATKKRLKLVGGIACLLGLFLAISIAGNAAATFGMLELAKDTSVGATASNAALVSTEKTNTNGLMMNKAGDHVVSTAAAKFRLNASDMPTASEDILYSLTHCYYTKE